jgi:hypothetical protein
MISVYYNRGRVKISQMRYLAKDKRFSGYDALEWIKNFPDDTLERIKDFPDTIPWRG